MNGISPYKAKLLAENRIRWHFGANDPGVIGWGTTAAYFVAAALVAAAAGSAEPRSLERRFWLAMGAIVLALGVNKQLDLHVLLIDLGRAWAVDHGLYQQRRTLQALFIGVGALAGVAFAGATFAAIRRRDPALRLAAFGLGLTAFYVALRAAAFNHTDSWLKTEIAGLRWDWTVEVAGLVLVGLGAWRFRARR